MFDPVIEQAGGWAFSIVNDPDSGHPLRLTIESVYVPAVETFIVCVVAPVDHR